jgi:putative ABC transport system substrate-binding protein
VDAGVAGVIDRRTFLSVAGLALLAAPLAADAQQAGKVYRIGVIDPGGPVLERPEWKGFFRELRDAGYVLGQNLEFEFRRADRPDKLSSYVEELLRLTIDMILTGGTPPTVAAKQATSTVPVVFYNVSDPVGSGLVASLSRPGGNLTGLTHISKEINSKRVELLKDAIPSLSRVALLAGASASLTLADTEAAARRLGLRPITVSALDPDAFEGAFAKMTKEGVRAVIILPDVFFFIQRQRIAELALKHLLPTVSELRGYVTVGGFMSYGASSLDTANHLGAYVVRILKGARPGDLPVQQPTKFELVINLKTAKALGLTIPPSLLLRADEIIQ